MPRSAIRPHNSRVLTDVDIISALIRGDLKITPMISGRDQIGANTVDLRLGTEFIVREVSGFTHLDPVELRDRTRAEIDRMYRRIKRLSPTDPFVLHPGQFALGSTLEYVQLPFHIGAVLEGRSRLAREGLNVHSTASFIHPGSRGIITFELENAGTVPLRLRVGTRIAQLWFYEMDGPVASPHLGDSGHGPLGDLVDHLAANYGRPWEDYECEVISERSKALAQRDSS